MDGGDGFTSNEAKRLQAQPEVKARQRAGRRAFAATPEGRIQIAQAVAASQVKVHSPEARAKRSRTHKALALTPLRQAQLARATALNNTPEAIAKRERMRRINDTWRRLAVARPDLFCP